MPNSIFYATGGSGNPWDVSTNFIPAAATYGLTVPMWFCPARPTETLAQETVAQSTAAPGIGHALTSISYLNQFLGSFFGWGTDLAVMNHCLWVERQAVHGELSNPNPADTLGKTTPAIWGWPQKVTDKSCGYVPIMSDPCFSGYGTSAAAALSNVNVAKADNAPLPALDKYSGHVFGGVLENLNLLYADGHVELHGRNQIQCYVENINGPADWFY